VAKNRFNKTALPKTANQAAESEIIAMAPMAKAAKPIIPKINNAGLSICRGQEGTFERVAHITIPIINITREALWQEWR
jgi:hypothetical protein